MRSIKFSWFVLTLCAALAWAAAPAAAWAQKGPKEAGAGIAAAQAATEPSYVFPYFIVVLSIGLGLFVLAKPSKRKNLDAKAEGPE